MSTPEPLSAPDVRPARLAAELYPQHFADAAPRYSRGQALVEAERCLYCFDAPCTTACPTGIDIPAFIARIAQGNLRGAARTILGENVLGGMCARVCPTEVLCEQACVRHTQEDKPVEIGLLQRHATDAHFAKPGAPLFSRGAPTGKRVAVVGAGPAGLACAHRLAMLGHAVTLFDDKPKLGGLNEYGLATYKTVDGFAQKEIDWLLSIGGIEVRPKHSLGRDMHLDALARDYDAVFLGLGLAGVNTLGIAEPVDAAARPAVDFIAELRQADSPAEVVVGRRVVVIGGGMTAVDAAVQSRLLGAEDVTMVYRRGPDAMSASGHEQQWAQTNGVRIKHWGAPQQMLISQGRVLGVRFARTAMRGDQLVETEERFDVEADMVLTAIGQSFEAQPLGLQLALKGGRIATDAEGQTSQPKVWAGGDCRYGGRDLTVEAVQDGKVAAHAIDRALRA